MHSRPSRLPAASALAGAMLLALALLLCGATLAHAESGPLFPEERTGAKSGQGTPATANSAPRSAPPATTRAGAVAHIHESATLPPASARTNVPTGTGAATGTGATPATSSAPATATPPPTTTIPATSTPGAPTPGTAAPRVGTSAAPPASATQPGAPHAATTTAAAAKHASAGKTRPSDLAIALAALAALLVLAVLAWGIARWNAWEPAWLLSLRHAFAEGGYHTSAGMAELRDWARLGR